MPVRATKRGAERTPLARRLGRAGLRRELRRTRRLPRARGRRRPRAHARPLRGRRAPDERLRGADGVARRARPRRASMRQTFGELVLHTPARTFRWPLPWTFSTFDYPRAVRAAARAGAGRRSSRRPRSTGAAGDVVHTDRGDLRAPLDRRRASAGGGCCPERRAPIQPPEARLSRGLEVHPHGNGRGPRALARSRVRPRRLLVELPGRATSCASASAPSTRATTSRSRPCAWRTTSTCRPSATRATGSPTRCATPVEDGVFFAGDSAGHCLPTTAEGIRTALYFGLACGRELRARARGPPDSRAGARALRRVLRGAPLRVPVAAARVQRLVGRVNPYPAMTTALAPHGPPVVR